MLFASHETAEVQRLADRVYILERGRARPGPALSGGGSSPDVAELEAELLRSGD